MPRWLPTARAVRGPAALFATALMIGACISEVVEWRYLRQPLEAAMQRSTGLSVRIDSEIRMHLLRSPMLSLRAPVTVTGTLAQRVVGIETEALLGRALAAAALAVLAPPAALLAILDFGDPVAEDSRLRNIR